MRRLRLMVLAVSVMAATVAGASTDPASARTSVSSQAGGTAPPATTSTSAAALRPAGAIALAPGVDLLPPSYGTAGVQHDGDNATSRGCPYYHLCVWRDIGFGWYGIGFYSCNTFDLAAWGFPPNHPFGVSSFANNQTDGTFSYFYDSDWTFLRSSRAPDFVWWVGDGMNDQARWVNVC